MKRQRPAETSAAGRFSTAGEISGAFGDLGTFLPYVVAVVGSGILAPGPVFFGFAAAYFTVAFVYRIPVAVQPMKALGAVIVAGGLTAPEIAWAGVIIGATLIVLAATPALVRAARAIPQSVVTGLQAGLGLLLGAVALEMMQPGWPLALPALMVLALSFVATRGPWALVVVAGGLAYGLFAAGTSPEPATQIAQARDLSILRVLADGVLPQLPLTLLNAIVVTAAVARSLYPDRAGRVTERRLAVTTGLLNVVLAPLGALPMCHGAGGVTAHFRFGARGIGAPVLIGVLCAAGALLGPHVVGLLAAIPLPVTGALLAFASADLIFSRRMIDARSDCRPVIAAAALGTFFWGALAGFAAGLAMEALRVRIVSCGKASAGTGDGSR